MAFVFNSIVVIYKLPGTKLTILRLLLQGILSLGWLYSLPVVLQEVVSSGGPADKCPAGAKAVILCLLGLFLSFSKELSTCSLPNVLFKSQWDNGSWKKTFYFMAEPAFKCAGSNKIAVLCDPLHCLLCQSFGHILPKRSVMKRSLPWFQD